MARGDKASKANAHEAMHAMAATGQLHPGTVPAAPLPAPAVPGDDFALPAKEVRVPENQLRLAEAELEDEVAKMLTANNPGAPKALVRFIQKERAYKAEAMIAQTMTHYATDGWLLHRDSEEAKKQQEQDRVEDELARKFAADLQHVSADPAADLDNSKELRNRFNFSERAAQTSALHPKDKVTATEPPPTLELSASCSQAAIYAEYVRDQERIEAQERAAKSKAAAKKGLVNKDDDGGAVKAEAAEPVPVMRSADLALAAQTVERMVNQNTFADIAMDFSFWEDPSDAYKPRVGTLLPLWRFTNERARRKSVTAVAWSSKHDDVFAVAYGSFDYTRPTSGLVCVFALANPTYPEVAFTTDAGALTLSFHPQHASLLALGLYDGTVAVCDAARPAAKGGPILCRSSIASEGHSEPVWQVAWDASDASKALLMYSVSADGRVLLWTVSKSTLEPEIAMRLRASHDPAETRPLTAAGLCIDFNQLTDSVYLVGTEEGAIHKCSKAYSSEYLATFRGHRMAVYSVRWNCFHPTAFLSASEDWTVKLWDAGKDEEAVATFDLGTSVGDVTWAPYSSTVFAVATADGKVSVFDLAQDRHKPLCCQKVVTRGALTKIAFNPRHPILLVGDDRSCVTTLKLSPNLRQICQLEGGQSVRDAEVAKLEAVLAVALKSRVARAAPAA